MRILFSFTSIQIFDNNISYNYVFPLLSPFEDDIFFIFDFFGNIIRSWGGQVFQFKPFTLKSYDFFNFFFSYFFNKLNYEKDFFSFLDMYISKKIINFFSNSMIKIRNIFFYRKKYFLFKKSDESLVKFLSSNLSIINARKDNKIY